MCRKLVYSSLYDDVHYVKSIKQFFTKKIINEKLSGIQAKEATSGDLETTAGPSSKMFEFTKLMKIDESPAKAKPVASDKLQTENDNNVVTAPPSPRTLLAIQAAMVESSSEEELGDEDTRRLNVDQSVEEGSVSPRTLQAIQQALSDGDKREEVVTVRTDGVLPQRSEVKDFLLSSSDEEDQIPEVKEGKKLPTSTIHLSNQVTVQDSEFEQKKQELEKNHVTPKDTSISRTENCSCIDNIRQGKDDVDKEDGSKMDLNSLGDKDINLCTQKPSCSPVETSIGLLIHAETTDLSKKEENLKISENTEKVISQTEENVSEVQKDVRFFPEAKGPEEEREVISQSEDSDSDGTCFLIV